MRGRKILLGALLSLVFLSQMSFAQTSTVTTGVQASASLVGSCILNGGSINFGTFSVGTGTTAVTGTINVTCSNTVAYDLVFSTGNSGNELQRSMTGQTSGDTLQYNIYTDSTHTTVIGDGANGTSHPLTGVFNSRPIVNGLASGRNAYIGLNKVVTWDIFGLINNNQYVTPDNYSDNLVITVSY